MIKYGEVVKSDQIVDLKKSEDEETVRKIEKEEDSASQIVKE